MISPYRVYNGMQPVMLYKHTFGEKYRRLWWKIQIKFNGTWRQRYRRCRCGYALHTGDGFAITLPTVPDHWSSVHWDKSPECNPNNRARCEYCYKDFYARIPGSQKRRHCSWNCLQEANKLTEKAWIKLKQAKQEAYDKSFTKDGGPW